MFLLDIASVALSALSLPACTVLSPRGMCLLTTSRETYQLFLLTLGQMRWVSTSSSVLRCLYRASSTRTALTPRPTSISVLCILRRLQDGQPLSAQLCFSDLDPSDFSFSQYSHVVRKKSVQTLSRCSRWSPQLPRQLAWRA